MWASVVQVVFLLRGWHDKRDLGGISVINLTEVIGMRFVCSGLEGMQVPWRSGFGWCMIFRQGEGLAGPKVGVAGSLDVGCYK